MLKVMLCALALTILAGCATKNEGKVDFRRTDGGQCLDKEYYCEKCTACSECTKNGTCDKEQCKNKSQYCEKCVDNTSSTENKEYYCEKCTACSECTKNGTCDKEQCKNKSQYCEKCVDEPRSNCGKEKKNNYQLLFKKNASLGTDTGFKKGDSLSLHLRTAYIANFSELEFFRYINPNNLISGFLYDQKKRVTGEIAVVANAFEESDKNQLDFNNLEAGRVVFYSDDVHKGQVLNFNNMPIYGPIEYKGAPFAFRIAIFELDVGSKQAKAMLDTIASAGSTAYPPASPVLDILNKIGSTFLSDINQINSEFRYTMVLDSKYGDADNLQHFRLETGNYIFVRKEERKKPVDWKNLLFDENKGVLYVKKTETEKRDDNKEVGVKNDYKLFTESTYLVVEINKGVSDLQINLAQNSFDDLLTVLRQQDQRGAADIENFVEEIGEASMRRIQIINFDKAKELLRNAKSATIKSAPSKMTLYRFQAKELFEMIAKSVRNKVKMTKKDKIEVESNKLENSSPLSDFQVEYILNKIKERRNYFDDMIKEGDKPVANIEYWWENLHLQKIYDLFVETDVNNFAKQKKFLDYFLLVPVDG